MKIFPNSSSCVLLGHPHVRRIRCQDAIERFEDLGPVLVGNADDVADDRHRQHIGDVVDPVAAACREQPVDQRCGARPNALLELADGFRGERVRHHPAPLGQVGRIHVDDGRKVRHHADGLDERTVDGGERIRVTVNPLGMPMLGRHPEVAFDRLGDAVGELVVEDRLLAAQLGEQIVGKSVPPQRRIRQIDRRRRGHACSSFGWP